MAQRVDIDRPPGEYGAVLGEMSPVERSLREWTRWIASSLRTLLDERPTGIAVANTPAQITGNQNDYDHGQVDILRVSTDASRNITGFDAQGFREFVLVNVGSFDVVLQNLNVGSASANQMTLSTGADITVSAKGSIRLWYDEDDSTWRDIA